MSAQITAHEKEVVHLRRIEGQIRGIIKMIEEKRYCIDILLQLAAVKSALSRVEEHILEKHISGCVVHAFKGASKLKKEEKIREVMEVLGRFRRGK